MHLGWEYNVELSVPSEWPSGVYVAQFVTGLGVRESIFVVRPKQATPKSKILWVLPDNTYHAYNVTGGKSTYGYHSTDSEYTPIVSLDRPYALDGTAGFLVWDQHFLAWLEREGIVVDICSQIDVHREQVGLLKHYNMVLRTGHDEYWTRAEYLAVEEYVAGGGNVAFFSVSFK